MKTSILDVNYLTMATLTLKFVVIWLLGLNSIARRGGGMEDSLFAYTYCVSTVLGMTVLWGLRWPHRADPEVEIVQRCIPIPQLAFRASCSSMGINL